jgi:hypothetical protein
MSTTTKKNAKRRTARKQAKFSAQSSAASAPGTSSSLTTQQHNDMEFPSQGVQDRAKSTDMDNRERNQGQSIRTGQSSPLDSMCRAQLELQIKLVKMNLQLEIFHAEHWKRELDKYDAELYRCAQMSQEYNYSNWDVFRQGNHVEMYDQTLVEDMLRLTQCGVVELKNRLSALEHKLKDILGPAVESDTK